MQGQDANYTILTKRVKLQHEKKTLLNLLSIQSVGFEQTFIKFIEIFVPQEQFPSRKKNCSGNHLSDHPREFQCAMS